MYPDRKGQNLLILDLAGMVAGTKYRGEFEERIKSVIDEGSGTQNILLFIDELHTMIEPEAPRISGCFQYS